MAHQLLLLVALPVAGACMLAVVPRARAGAVTTAASAVAALTLALAVPLWFRFAPRGTQWQLVDRIDWAGWQATVAVDGFALVMVLLTTMMSLVAALLLARNPDARVKAWGGALLLVEAGVLGALVSLDARQLFAFWQLAIVAVVAMIALAGRTSTAIGAAGFAVVGAVALYAGIAVLGEHYRDLSTVASFDVREFQTMPVPRPVQMQAFALIALGALTPFVVIAFAGWSAARSEGALAAGLPSWLLLAVLSIFGFFRLVLPVVPQATRSLAPAMMIAGGVAAALAVAAAARSRPRLAVYCVGVAQALLAVVGLFAATPNAVTGAAVQLGAATLMVAALVPIAEPARGTSTRGDVLGLAFAFVALTIGLGGGGRQLISGLAPFGVAAAYAPMFVSAAGAIVLVAIGVRRWNDRANGSCFGLREIAIAALPCAMMAAVIAPGLVDGRIETSVARVIVRVSPEYASQVADCLDQPPPPPPPDSGLPAGMMLAAPCADPSGSGDSAVKR